MTDPVECFFKPFYDWSEPTVTENKQEEVQVKADFSESKSVFFEGEDVVVKAAIIVTNPLDAPYTVEPRCFINDRKENSYEMELLPSPLFEGGALTFRKSEIEQRASVTCRKRGGLEIVQEKDTLGETIKERAPVGELKKEIEGYDFELHLERNIVARAEWNVYTMNKEALALKDDPFAGIQENLRGRTVLSKMKYASPLKVVIGSDNDQPFFEGSWPFSVILRKRDIDGNITLIKSVTIHDPKSRTVRLSQPCEFDEGFDSYSLSSDKVGKATRILKERDTPIDIQCTLQVQNLDSSKLTPEKSIVSANVEFQFESIYELPITILKESVNERV